MASNKQKGNDDLSEQEIENLISSLTFTKMRLNKDSTEFEEVLTLKQEQ